MKCTVAPRGDGARHPDPTAPRRCTRRHRGTVSSAPAPEPYTRGERFKTTSGQMRNGAQICGDCRNSTAEFDELDAVAAAVEPQPVPLKDERTVPRVVVVVVRPPTGTAANRVFSRSSESIDAPLPSIDAELHCASTALCLRTNGAQMHENSAFLVLRPRESQVGLLL